MPKYRIEGQVYDAQTPESAYALHANRMAGTEYNPTDDMGTMDRFLSGVGSGMVNVGRQVGNMVGLVDDETIREQEKIDKPLMDTTAGTVGRVGGEIAATLPFGMGAGGAAAKGLSMLPRAGAAMTASTPVRGLVPLMAEGAAEGAILAGPGERGAGAMTGGAFGGALGTAGAAGSRLMRGVKNISPEARRLLDEGIDLTPGQLNPGGWSSAFEESMTGRLFPATREARQAAGDDVFTTLVNKALPENATPVPKGINPQAALDKAYDSFKVAYDDVKGFPVYAKDYDTTLPLNTAFDVIANRAAGLSRKVRDREKNWLLNEFTRLDKVTPAGRDLQKLRKAYGPDVYYSDHLLDLRSSIRTRIREQAKKTDPNWDVVRMLEDAEDQVTRVLRTQMPEELMNKLARTDQKYHNYKVLEDAVFKAGAGELTPSRMSNAVRASMEKGAYSRGASNELKDITDAASSALRENVPKTGAGLAMPWLTGAVGSAIGAATGLPGGAVLGTALPAALTALRAGTSAGRKQARGELGVQRVLQRAMDKYNQQGYANPILRAAIMQQGYED